MSIKDARQIAGRPAEGSKSKDGSVIDAQAIRELAELLSETSLTEIEIEQNGLRIRVCRAVTPAAVSVHAPAAAVVQAAEAPTAKREGHAPGTVTSPMVGTVYVAPEPGAEPFVKVGDTVKEGDTLLIVEAMKTMNPILAPKAGTVTEISVRDAEPVEFGQALLAIA